jgi:phosphatidylserine/phosphatidylglycerophosphate/cardiolipin synthase-like enzyme
MFYRFLLLFIVAATFSASAWAYPAKFAVSPDSSQALLTEVVQSARSKIILNVYMLTSGRLQQALVDKMNSGVTVQLLIETQPFGGKIVPPAKILLDRLAAAIGKSKNPNNRLFMMNDRDGSVKRRYVFDHAKYVVIDDTTVYISSENFVNSGAMADPARKGNRGWQVAMDSKTVAKQLSKVFAEDTASGNPDVTDYDPKFVKVLTTPAPPAGDNSRNQPLFAGGRGDVKAAALCLSPDSLSCMVNFIRSAKDTLEVEHLSLPLYWPAARGAKAVSPLIEEMIAAAKRGVKVRVLMNPGSDDEQDNSPGAPPAYDSKETMAYLKKAARDGKLSLQAAEFNIDATQTYLVHNKGMIVDGKRAFVSSINGTQNSIMNNRELGVALDSADAARYFGEVFNFDWTKSAR